MSCAPDPESRLCGDLAGPPDAVTGLITSIDRDGTDRITRLTVEDRTLGDVRVYIDHERDYGFDLEHLEEHRIQGDPVRVTLKEDCGRLYATEVLDA